VDNPIIKSIISPAPAVVENGSFINVLIKIIAPPPSGPKTNPPIMAGKLEN
jgi:hypothetical protein